MQLTMILVIAFLASITSLLLTLFSIISNSWVNIVEITRIQMKTRAPLRLRPTSMPDVLAYNRQVGNNESKIWKNLISTHLRPICRNNCSYKSFEYTSEDRIQKFREAFNITNTPISLRFTRQIKYGANQVNDLTTYRMKKFQFATTTQVSPSASPTITGKNMNNKKFQLSSRQLLFRRKQFEKFRKRKKKKMKHRLPQYIKMEVSADLGLWYICIYQTNGKHTCQANKNYNIVSGRVADSSVISSVAHSLKRAAFSICVAFIVHLGAFILFIYTLNDTRLNLQKSQMMNEIDKIDKSFNETISKDSQTTIMNSTAYSIRSEPDANAKIDCHDESVPNDSFRIKPELPPRLVRLKITSFKFDSDTLSDGSSTTPSQRVKVKKVQTINHKTSLCVNTNLASAHSTSYDMINNYQSVLLQTKLNYSPVKLGNYGSSCLSEMNFPMNIRRSSKRSNTSKTFSNLLKNKDDCVSMNEINRIPTSRAKLSDKNLKILVTQKIPRLPSPTNDLTTKWKSTNDKRMAIVDVSTKEICYKMYRQNQMYTVSITLITAKHHSLIAATLLLTTSCLLQTLALLFSVLSISDEKFVRNAINFKFGYGNGFWCCYVALLFLAINLIVTTYLALYNTVKKNIKT
ncbi:hypothetical protein SNEBB_009920 [Seison nebaliae]|nr:hypothetical protein SNEBB_009920 [Seison nebaliae]